MMYSSIFHGFAATEVRCLHALEWTTSNSCVISSGSTAAAVALYMYNHAHNSTVRPSAISYPGRFHVMELAVQPKKIYWRLCLSFTGSEITERQFVIDWISLALLVALNTMQAIRQLRKTVKTLKHSISLLAKGRDLFIESLFLASFIPLQLGNKALWGALCKFNISLLPPSRTASSRITLYCTETRGSVTFCMIYAGFNNVSMKAASIPSM